MRLPPLYTAFCVIVLAVFSYAKFEGLALGGSSFGVNGATRNADGSFSYTGTSNGYHK